MAKLNSHLAGLGLLTIGVAASPAFAQQQSTELKGVTVTGSNIPRTEKETAAPIQIISRKEIEATGKQNVAEVIQSISANNSDSLPMSFSNGFASGGAGVSLRGLGVNATLVLINGRRMSPYGLADDGVRTFVDLNTIPLEAVERIEVLKDGASAIYGSDAIAGVVNVILRKDYRGGEVGAHYGANYAGDASQSRITGTWGFGNLQTQHYNVFGTIEATHQNAMFNTQRGGYLATSNLTPWGGYDSTAGNATAVTASLAAPVIGIGNGNPSGYAFYAPVTPYGVIAESGTLNTPIPSTGNYNMTSCPQVNANTGVCSYDFIGYSQIQPKMDRVNLYTRGTYQVNENMTAYLEAGYFFSNTIGSTTPSTIGGAQTAYSGNLTNPIYNQTFDLPANHPDNPSKTDVNTANGQYFAWSAVGNGPRTSNLKNNVLRLIGGINGEVWGGTYDFGGGFMQSRLDDTQEHYLQLNATNAALANGTLRVNPALVPQSVWNTISPNLETVPMARTVLVDGHFSRPILTMPWGGGDMAFAVGAEYRNENTKTPPVPGTNTGQTVGLGFSQAFLNRDIAAGYAELDTPITKYVDIDMAYRLDHYSDFGYAQTPKVGVKITPIEQFAIRGTYSEAFRAPGPAEFGAQSASVGFTNVAVVTVGNPNLKPERARSFTLGTVIEPIKGSSLSVDYYHILRKRDIEEADPAAIEGQFPGSSTPFTCINGANNSAACYGASGAIVAVLSPFQNGDYTTTQGLDFDWQEQIYRGSYGKVSADLTWTHIMQFTRDLNGTITQYAGTSGPFVQSSDTGTPRDHATLDINWEVAHWAWTGVVNYVGPMQLIDHWGESLTDTGYKQSVGGQYEVYSTSGGEEFPGYPVAPSAAAAGLNGQACGVYGPNGLPFAGCRLRAFTTFDLFGKYTGIKHWELSASVQNLFNSMPPLDPYTYGGANYNPAWHQSGAIGRYFTFGAKYKF